MVFTQSFNDSSMAILQANFFGGPPLSEKIHFSSFPEGWKIR